MLSNPLMFQLREDHIQTTLLGALILLGSIALFGTSCLVNSRCMSNSDCTGNEQCDTVNGVCFLECGSDRSTLCPDDRPQCLVAANSCVECLEDSHCSTTGLCHEGRCVAEEAPSFTLVDMNPGSPSFEEDLSLSDFQGDVVLLFFATLG